MAPRTLNYSLDRMNCERAHAAKAQQKTGRKAEETVRRKADKNGDLPKLD